MTSVWTCDPEVPDLVSHRVKVAGDHEDVAIVRAAVPGASLFEAPFTGRFGLIPWTESGVAWSTWARRCWPLPEDKYQRLPEAATFWAAMVRSRILRTGEPLHCSDVRVARRWAVDGLWSPPSGNVLASLLWRYCIITDWAEMARVVLDLGCYVATPRKSRDCQWLCPSIDFKIPIQRPDRATT